MSDNEEYIKVKEKLTYYGLKRLSVKSYKNALKTFERQTGLTPSKLLEMELSETEDITEDFIRRNKNTYSPKHLNVIYCAIKAWLHANRKIKSKREFREIKFDKTSLKNGSLLTANMLETNDVKQIISLCDACDEITIGLYGFGGLRPSIIPQLRVKHIHKRSYEIVDNRIKLKKPTLLIVPQVDGNKANIPFISFIPSKIAEKIEQVLNQNIVTTDTKLTCEKNERAVYYTVTKYYKKIGFEGIPYRLRNFADDLLDRITVMFNDEDFKEFLMGHKGDISAIYQNKGLTIEKENNYRDMYIKAVDSWIDNKIYGSVSTEEMNQATLLKQFAISLGINEDKANQIFDLMKAGRMTIKQFRDRLAEETKRNQENTLRSMIKEELKLMNGE